jgi:hypothetical protein
MTELYEPPSRRDENVLLPREQSVSAKKRRKTHAQLQNEFFRNVQCGSPQHANSVATSILSPNPQRIRRRKTHQELWQEVFPNGPEPDITVALASPVQELPIFTQTSSLVRSRSATVVRTQPTVGISRTPSLRPSPLTPAPPMPQPRRMRAMSRATVRPTAEAEPSTRTKQIVNSFLSHPAEENPSDKENFPISMPRSQVRLFELDRPYSGSTVQRTAHVLTHSDGE